MTNLEMAAKAQECADYVKLHGFAKFFRHGIEDQACALGVIENIWPTPLHEKYHTPELIEDVWDGPEFLEVVAELIPWESEFHCYTTERRDIKSLKERFTLFPQSKIAGWNNADSRKAEDLIELFETAATVFQLKALQAGEIKLLPEKFELVGVYS